MKKNANSNVIKAPEQTSQPLVVNNIILRNVDRTPKDVGRWRDAHKSAESIYYPNRTRLYDLYMDVILDAHLSGTWLRRESSVVNKKFVFVDKNEEPVDEINELIGSSEFREMMKELMRSLMWGVTGFEFVPGEKFQCKLIDRKHIKPEKKVIVIEQSDYDGTSYEDIDNIWVIAKERDLGLLLKCAFYVLLKKGAFSDWANYIEIFGQPIMKFLYDSFDEKTKSEINKLMEEAGASLKIALPKQADFDVLDGKTSNGNGDLQDKFKNACNDEISLIILTVTETTKSSHSSGYAQSKTQSDEQFEIITDDILFITALLNSDKFISILKSYDYPVEGGKFIVDEPMKQGDQLVRAQVLQTLKSLGLPMDDDDLYKNFGVKKPDDYEAQKAESEKLKAAAVVPSDSEESATQKKKQPNNKQRTTNNKPSNQSAWRSFRQSLADFFDPAHS